MHFSPFEVIMLLCFGASWPFSIWKTIRTKNPAGKSSTFGILVFIGYLCGCLHKVIYRYDAVFWLYAFNSLLVLTDLALCAYYRRHPRPQAP